VSMNMGDGTNSQMVHDGKEGKRKRDVREGWHPEVQGMGRNVVNKKKRNEGRQGRDQ
jgi:hypothetical protein